MKFLKLEARYTSIRQIVEIDDGFIVLENWDGYPEGKSALYKVDKAFNLMWDAFPVRKEYIINLYLKDPKDSVITVSLSSSDADLNTHTGEMTNFTFQK